IEPDLIKEVLSKYDSELEKELIFAYLEKYKDKEKEKPVKKQKLLLMQKLQRAGFRSDAINSCLKITEFTDESADFIDEKIGRMEEKYADLDERKKRERIIRHLLSEGYPYDEILLHLKHEE
ncbi:MAG TPA: RecX family transcriptional regulator, partial [Bacilli bacterium]